jgi:bifunctional non-homologous end joining protein LigD
MALPAILLLIMFQLQPMPLQHRRDPFDHPDWLFELKYDGFRALAVIQAGRTHLVSRNGHPFMSFASLSDAIGSNLDIDGKTVLDGEIVCMDRHGRPQFKDLLFHRGTPCFFAFDLLMLKGKDWRAERLINRKKELRRLLNRLTPNSRLQYVDHVDDSGIALFQRVCELDLEGIVAKHKFGPYVAERESSTWAKVLNRGYSQKKGREELFERERKEEPVAGWHSCVIACVELEAS